MHEHGNSQETLCPSLPDDVIAQGTLDNVYQCVENFVKTSQICNMPKVTYPRPCPTCGKEMSKGFFFQHKKQCSTTKNRYHCSYCPLSFSQKPNMERHVQQQHSKTPQWFTCPKCHQVFTTKMGMKFHLETVCAEIKPSFNRQMHMRKVHGRVCREQDINFVCV